MPQLNVINIFKYVLALEQSLECLLILGYETWPGEGYILYHLGPTSGFWFPEQGS